MRQGRSLTGQGSNSVLVGDFNERVVLTTLRRFGPASKTDLARLVGLTKNAAGVIVRKLEDGGLVRATGKRYGGRGQPATILEIDPGGAYSIGVRIDRDLVECVLADLNATILDRTLLEDLPEPEAALVHIAESVRRFKARLKPAEQRRLIGIGVAIPYNMGSWLGVLNLPVAKFRAWDAFDLKPALAQATGLPVFLENDGSAATVGELNRGRGREVRHFLYVFLGPAIGGGVVVDGDYLRGHQRNAGDISVIPVRPSSLSSAPVTGRAYDPLLSRASLNALIRHFAYRGHPMARTDLDSAIAALPDVFSEWEDDAIDALVAPVLAAMHLLDIGTVVLDGDLAGPVLDAFAAKLGAALAVSVSESRDPPEVLRGTLGRDAAAVGAASLPLHASFSPMRTVLTGEAPEILLDLAS